MADYGFRISKTGDVKTCDDLDTSVNSKYSLLKGKLSGSGNITVGGDDIQTVTVAHSLGYIPFAQVYIKLNSEGFWRESPLYFAGMGVGTFANHYCNTGNLYIRFEQYGSSSETFYYQYFIYLDKGDL